MKFLYLLFLISILKCGYGFERAKVQMDTYYGDITFTIVRANQETEISCFTKNVPDPEGKFEWYLDDQILDQNSQEDTTEDGRPKSTYKYKPNLEDENKKLKCSYIQENNGESYESSAQIDKISVHKVILPPSPYKPADSFNIGETANINMKMKLFPKPNDDQIVWSVENKVNGNTESLASGKNTDKYESQMNSLGNDEYEAILTIKNLDESDNENNYYLEFTPNDEEPQRIVVDFVVGEPVKPTTVGTTIIPTEEPSTPLGIGLWIIIALVILIILACIAYCVWQKYFREKPEDNTKPNYDPNNDAERGTFAAVPQTDTTQDANVDTSSNK